LDSDRRCNVFALWAFFYLRGTPRTAVGARGGDGATVVAAGARRITSIRALSGAFDFGFCAVIDFSTDGDRTICWCGRPWAEAVCADPASANAIKKAIRLFMALSIEW
jgi:hypothetical protein